MLGGLFNKGASPISDSFYTMSSVEADVVNEPFPLNTNDNILSFTNISNDNSSGFQVCTFKEITSLKEFINLFKDNPCHRHSFGFTVFLCLANLLILIFGLLGNSLVIYVVLCRIKKRTASSLFILNLAVADLLVILCCIPATLVANIFTPWIFGEAMCKIVAYAQGVSVFCSVYSLVAISLDRCRAIHQSVGLSPNISTSQAVRIILLIWIIGLTMTLPWAFVFKLVHLNPGEGESSENLPFCHEAWVTKSHEIAYFLLIHVLACFLLPLGLISICNVVIWRSVLGLCQNSVSLSSSALCANVIHNKRKLRVLKMFTCLTFVFFMFWLPLYLIMARVKFFYDDQFTGCPWEQELISILIPIAQLLGSCNSCVNPVLYALLNQKFRESFKWIFVCPTCHVMGPSSISIVTRGDTSLAAVVRPRLGFKDTAV